jgi:hypothetical protein
VTTITTIPQDVSTNCNFSTTNINSEVESTNFVTSISTALSNSSYRKSYIAWDKLERANKPDNYTKKTKYLSKNAKALLSVVYQKLKRQPLLLLNHKYISTITGAGSRQNQNVINELSELLDISYHRSAEDHKGKKYEYVYKFTHKKVHTDSSGDRMIRKKISASNTPSTYIDKNNIINNRSRANFVKNSFDSFFTEKNSELETKNEDNEVKKNQKSKENFNNAKNASSEQSSAKPKNKPQNKNIKKPKKNRATPTHNTNGFLGSGKYLHEVLNHLTDEMCSIIRTKCGKDFTNRAIREIAKAVSRSKKGAKAFFYHIKGFIAYLAKILTFEKRDPVKISGTNYYITSNQTDSEKEMREQEKYLTDIEYSLQVSPEWHLKKKLAAVLDRSKAYNLLTSYKSLEILEGRAVITLNSHMQFSRLDKDLILRQIQATHEKMDDSGNYQPIESLEIIIPNKSIALNSSAQKDQTFPKREGVWGKIRETFASYFGSEGDAIDKSWLSNFNASVDNREKIIELQAPSRFVKDWVESNYLSYIEDAAKVNGLIIKCIK